MRRQCMAFSRFGRKVPSTAGLEFDTDLFATIRLTPALKRSLFAAHPKDVRNKEHVEAMIRHICDVVRETVADLDAAA